MTSSPPIAAAQAAAGDSSFAAFRRLVLDNPQLQETLAVLTTADLFVREVVAMGSRHDFVFTAEDVTRAMAAGRRAMMAHLEI